MKKIALTLAALAISAAAQANDDYVETEFAAPASIEEECRLDAESSGISEADFEIYVQDCIERLQQEESADEY